MSKNALDLDYIRQATAMRTGVKAGASIPTPLYGVIPLYGIIPLYGVIPAYGIISDS